MENKVFGCSPKGQLLIRAQTTINELYGQMQEKSYKTEILYNTEICT